MSGWRATIPTERLFGDPRFLMLDESDQSLLLRLYARCDKWGRGPAHRNVLAVHLCLMRTDVREQLGRLGAFVLVYTVEGHEYYQILDYDADAMRETLRKRGPSNYPAPPQAGATAVVNDTQAGPTTQKNTPKAGLGVEKSEPYSGPTPAQRRPDPAETPPEVGPEAGLPPQKTGVESALVRARQQSVAERSVAEQSAVRVRAHDQAGLDPVPPPDKRVTDAVALWQKHFKATMPTGMVDDASVLSVAKDFTPEDFAAGVERHCDEGIAYWSKTPIRFLRLRCEWARDDAAKRAAAPPPAQRYSGAKRPPRGEAY